MLLFLELMKPATIWNLVNMTDERNNQKLRGLYPRHDRIVDVELRFFVRFTRYFSDLGFLSDNIVCATFLCISLINIPNHPYRLVSLRAVACNAFRHTISHGWLKVEEHYLNSFQALICGLEKNLLGLKQYCMYWLRWNWCSDETSPGPIKWF